MAGVLELVLLSAGLGGLVLAAVIDVKSRLIPNPTVLWVAAIGMASRVVADGWSSWISLVVAVAVFLPLGLMAGRNLVGGGDAKMIAAATLLVEPARILGLLLAISLAGGALAAAYLVRGAVVRNLRARRVARAPHHPAPDLGGLAAAAADPTKSVPYGLAILAGAAAIIFDEAFGCFSATSC